MKIHGLLFATLFAVSLSIPAVAQPPPDAPGQTAAARKRFEKLRDKVLKEKVGLSDAKATKVVTIFKKYRTERQKTQAELGEARKGLRKLLQDDSDDQQAYEAALTKLQAAAKKLDQLRDQQFAELKAALTPKEQAKLLRAMQKVRRLLNQRRANRAGPKAKPPRRGKGKGKGPPPKRGKKGRSSPELEF